MQTEKTILDELFDFLHEKGFLDNIVIKGGFLLEKVYNNSRQTTDIDGYFLGFENSTWERMKESFIEFAKMHNIDENDIKLVDPIEGRMSARFKFRYEGIEYGIDISIESYLAEKYATNVINGISINSYPVERVLADKTQAMFSRQRFRRTKDLFDINYLLRTQDVDKELYLEYLSKKELEIDENYPFTPERLLGLEHAYDMLQLSRLDTEYSEIEKPDFMQVVKLLESFWLDVINNPNEKEKVWSHTKLKWEPKSKVKGW